MIEKFIRTENYFKNKLEKENKKIASSDFDSQFNNISSYLDSIIKPAIDNLVSATLVGVNGNAGAFLHNVGDGTTDWQLLDSDLLDDYSIAFKKLVNNASGSLLISGIGGNITELIPNADAQVLFGRNGNIPEWRKIGTNDITNSTLTGNQFGKLAMENFTNNQFITNIVPNIIATENIQDGAITNAKIADGSISFDKLGIFAGLPVISNGFTTNHINDEALSSEKVKDFTIPITDEHSSIYEYNLWGNEYGIAKDSANINHKQLLKSENILDNSIDDSQLAPLYSENYLCVNTPTSLQFQSNHIALKSITGFWLDQNFESDVAAAIKKIISLK